MGAGTGAAIGAGAATGTLGSGIGAATGTGNGAGWTGADANLRFAGATGCLNCTICSGAYSPKLTVLGCNSITWMGPLGARRNWEVGTKGTWRFSRCLPLLRTTRRRLFFCASTATVNAKRRRKKAFACDWKNENSRSYELETFLKGKACFRDGNSVKRFLMLMRAINTFMKDVRKGDKTHWSLRIFLVKIEFNKFKKSTNFVIFPKILGVWEVWFFWDFSMDVCSVCESCMGSHSSDTNFYHQERKDFLMAMQQL